MFVVLVLGFVVDEFWGEFVVVGGDGEEFEVVDFFWCFVFVDVDVCG